MSGRNRGRTPSNASNSTSNRSTSTIKNNKKKKKNEIFHNRNESEENNRAYSERERDCSSLYDGTPEECSPSAGCRTPVASTIFQSKNSSSGAENIAVRDIRSHHRTAVLALPSKLTIAEDQILVKNPILLGDIGISVGGMNSENNRPFGSSVESKPGLEKENDEDGGIKIKDYSTRSDEVDVDYLSFSSTPSSIFPYHYPSPSFGTVRESVKRNEERNAGEDSNDSQEIPDSEYDSDSSVGDSSGKIHLHLPQTLTQTRTHT